MAPWIAFLLNPTIIISLILLLLLASLSLSKLGWSSRRMPPGPTPLPFIGNLHLLNITRQDVSFMELSKTYGPVFTFHLGLQKIVVLVGYEAVKEALLSKGNEFIDRPPIPIFLDIQREYGLFFSIGELWKNTRRFTLTTFRDLGMGTSLIEGKILEELQFLVERVNSFKGEPFALKTFAEAPTNITFTILFGDRFDYDDPTFTTLLRLIHEVMSLLGAPALHLYNVYPFLGFLLKPHKEILKRIREACEIIEKYMRASKEKLSRNQLQSYIDSMLFKQLQEGENGKKNTFHNSHVLASVLDLVMAGTETTATTLQWAALMMMKYPEIQRKVKQEIQQVLGSGRLPVYEDRNKMPFTNAMIHEVQRFSSIVQHFPRCTAVDTHFRGYFIPKGTPVFPSLTSSLYDETQWETPNRFNPNHFLDAEGNFVKKDAFLPFSIGRRNCLGENLARMELFIFVVGLLQRFTFQALPGMRAEDLELTTVPAFTRRPLPYSTCAVPTN
ncbi:cytochrome P450 2W1 [Thamnophis elegans]|uniref:cytochrome P450 2W1 n=1 Tax=Thamnophis elegans TaxID=35005 RepID=UPI001376FD4D|nr:cytochrome P450 2W1 [Thamnophis elegans]XP_032086274.1 cytochrome P450 2W1 [Thamnophis elegans]